MALGEKTQQQSHDAVENDKNTLPLQTKNTKFTQKNIDSATVAQYATIVKKPKRLICAIIRPQYALVSGRDQKSILPSFHHGDLDFKGKKERILDLLKSAHHCRHFRSSCSNPGDSQQPLPVGRLRCQRQIGMRGYFRQCIAARQLPFELPSSMGWRTKKPMYAYDSVNPLFGFGWVGYRWW